MRFVSRAEWGAREPRDRTRIPGPVRGVTLHWEGPDMGQPGPHVWSHSRCDNYVRQIQNFHLDGRGWDDIAYSGVVCAHGYVFEGRGPNLRTAANGTNSGNDHWYALCYLGGQGDAFTDDGRQGFKDGVDWLRRQGDAGNRVNGHRDHKNTACPGNDIYAWLQDADWNDLDGDEEDMWEHRYYFIDHLEVPAGGRGTLVMVHKDGHTSEALGADMLFDITVELDAGGGHLVVYQWDPDIETVYHNYKPVPIDPADGLVHTRTGVVTHGRHLRLAVESGEAATVITGGRVDMHYSKEI